MRIVSGAHLAVHETGTRRHLATWCPDIVVSHLLNMYASHEIPFSVRQNRIHESSRQRIHITNKRLINVSESAAGN